MNKIIAYLKLMRFHKPIGILLLLWPTEWGLWFASKGIPNRHNFLVFTLGVIVMRAAGCIINDIADRQFDKAVWRTQGRPLVTGEVSLLGAWILFFLLCSIGLALVLTLNHFSLFLACIALSLSILYPFMKRWFYAPQLILGLGWYMGILMTFASVQNSLPPLAWLLYCSATIWTLAYDSMYALADRADDLKIGVKSLAILMGKWDKLGIGFFQILTLGLWISIGKYAHLNIFYYFGLMGTIGCFIYEQWLIRNREPLCCLKAFTHNHWVGLSLFLGIFLSFLPS